MHEKFIDGITILIPSFNEGESLRTLLPEINSVMEIFETPYEIIVVDSMIEMDDTKSVCAENKCVYINRLGGNTFGDALRSGFEKMRFSHCITMDADGGYNPKYLINMFNESELAHKNSQIDKVDLIIGSRYVRSGKGHSIFMLDMMSRVLNTIYAFVLGIKIKDLSSNFRMYKSSDLLKINPVSNNFDIIEEILVLLLRNNKNYKIKEIPICFEERHKGKSKRKLIRFIMTYLHTLCRLKSDIVNPPPPSKQNIIL